MNDLKQIAFMLSVDSDIVDDANCLDLHTIFTNSLEMNKIAYNKMQKDIDALNKAIDKAQSHFAKYSRYE